MMIMMIFNNKINYLHYFNYITSTIFVVPLLLLYYIFLFPQSTPHQKKKKKQL